MNLDLHFSAILTLVSILFLLAIVHMYKRMQVDAFRQELFELRDDLFFHASKGVFSFEDPAYRMVRSIINGYIRFAHRSSFIPTMLFLMQFKKLEIPSRVKHRDQMSKSIAALPEEKRKLMGEIVRRLHFLHVKHMVKVSIILTIVFMIVLVGMILNDVVKKLFAVAKSPKVALRPHNIVIGIQNFLNGFAGLFRASAVHAAAICAVFFLSGGSIAGLAQGRGIAELEGRYIPKISKIDEVALITAKSS